MTREQMIDEAVRRVAKRGDIRVWETTWNGAVSRRVDDGSLWDIRAEFRRLANG